MKLFALLFAAALGARNCDMWRCNMMLDEQCGSNGVTYGKLDLKISTY